MKQTLFFILIFILFVGCTKSEIKDSLITGSHANTADAITILPANITDKKFAECLKREMEIRIPNLKVIPEDRFRDALFPWFELDTAPKHILELSNLLSKTLIRERIEDLGLEFLIYVHGVTTYDEGYGLMVLAVGPAPGGGVVGYISVDRETHISTTLWNLKEAVSEGDTDIHVKGKVRLLGLIIPVPIPAFTETEACNETAKRISKCLTGKGSHTYESEH